MNKVLEYFKNNKEVIINKKIHVYGWQKEYDYMLINSVTKYLFEELTILENIAPLTNENRDGRIKPKYYITVHDTGDADEIHDAKFWSETVKKCEWEMGKYLASFQYVVGNDGIYHQIPDNEVAYHAGDTTKYDYTLYDTLVKGKAPFGSVTISEDGYYEVNNEKTNLVAPRIYKVKDDKVILDRLPKTSDINSEGILCKLIDGKYYIGETYFNTSFEKIANRGGNNNSIGIESCINIGSDIYLTWQRTAKLVAYLLKENNLDINGVKQHHYFSGKNCPQTMRMNGMWDKFIELVMFEYKILLYKEEGYKIELICDNPCVDKLGRIKEYNKPIKFIIKTTFKNKSEELELII